MRSRVRLWQVDAFTDEPFRGNPAAVCCLDSSDPDTASDVWRQAVAAEMNLSETAFVSHAQGDDYRLRWFTPQVEVDLCGHATLATAHVLWTEGMHPRDKPLHFQTRSGILICRCRDAQIEMDFPATPVRPSAANAELLESLGVTPQYVGTTQFDHFVQIDDPQALRDLAPDYARLKRVATRGIIVTSRSDEADYDFLSRFFAPAVGIDEDPVTGSAHCCLAPYWSAVLGKSSLSGYQASPRGGVVQTRVAGDRVILGGQAVTVLSGELLASSP